MPQTDVGQLTTTDMSSTVTDLSIPTATIDGISDQKETEYMNQEWTEQLGYYHNNKAPQSKAVINARAKWTVGKGYKADETTTLILDQITGYGKDTFNSILKNMSIVTDVGGDSFAEIITNEEGYLVNLKPLDASAMKIIANRKGIIIRYELVSKVKGIAPQKFKPEDIFHLTRNRIADEIHGQSLIKILAWNLQAISELKDDWKTVMHRNVVPLRIIEVDSDDTTKLNRVKIEYQEAIKNKEVIVIPKGTVEIKDGGIAPNATLSPLPFIEKLENEFYEAAGVPKIIVGGAGGFTEAAVKIAYLAFQQTIEDKQLFFEEQVLAQLNLVINLEFPVSLENELLSDKAKDGPENIQPNETTAGVGE